MEEGVAVGGWCPAGRLAEDGVVPAHHPLQAAPRRGYSDRTLRNVLDSDATLILYFGQLSGRTLETLLRCIQPGRPFHLVDAREVVPSRAAELASEFGRSR